MAARAYQEVSDITLLPAPDETGCIAHYAFQYIDFNQVPQYVAAGHRFSDCCFLGCEIPTEMEGHIGCTCLVFPRMGRIYNAFRGNLYTGETLYAGYDPEHEDSYETCFDARVYADYKEKGVNCDDIRETLGRTMHDRAIGDAMREFLSRFDERQVVAIMGGHAQQRTDESFRRVASIAKALTERGKLMASGGGPGAMEATHFGAWMAGRTPEEFNDALEILSVAPTFRDEGWLRTAFEVRKKYPQSKYRSLGIPTWFYGHEPATPFATHIAKYFFNNLRSPEPDGFPGQGILHEGRAHLSPAGGSADPREVQEPADFGDGRRPGGHRHIDVLPAGTYSRMLIPSPMRTSPPTMRAE